MGKCYHAFPRSIAGKDLIILGVTHDDSSHQELIDLISGGRYWNAASINVIIPFPWLFNHGESQTAFP